MSLLQMIHKQTNQPGFRTISINPATFTAHNCRPVIVLDDFVILSCLNYFFVLDKNSYEVLQVIPETLASVNNPALWGISGVTALPGNRFMFRMHGPQYAVIYSVTRTSFSTQRYEFNVTYAWCSHDAYDPVSGKLFMGFPQQAQSGHLINLSGMTHDTVSGISGSAHIRGENVMHKNKLFLCSNNGTGGGESNGEYFELPVPLSINNNKKVKMTTTSTYSRDAVCAFLDCGDKILATYAINNSHTDVKVFESSDAGTTWTERSDVPLFVGGVRLHNMTAGLFKVVGETNSTLKTSRDAFATIEQSIDLGIKFFYGLKDFSTSPVLNGNDILLYDKGILYIINI